MGIQFNYKSSPSKWGHRLGCSLNPRVNTRGYKHYTPLGYSAKERPKERVCINLIPCTFLRLEQGEGCHEMTG